MRIGKPLACLISPSNLGKPLKPLGSSILHCPLSISFVFHHHRSPPTRPTGPTVSVGLSEEVICKGSWIHWTFFSGFEELYFESLACSPEVEVMQGRSFVALESSALGTGNRASCARALTLSGARPGCVLLNRLYLEVC